MTSTYDGDGKRVKRCTGTTPPGTCATNPTGMLYWYSPGGSILTETDLSGTVLYDYIYFAGRRIGRGDSQTGAVRLYYQDVVGSTRTITGTYGVVCFDADYYPFGSQRTYVNNCPQSYNFTGMQTDSASGDDHTWFRQYSPLEARWLSADPLAGDVTDPQSLNRYAYVLNNPCGLTDRLGLNEGCAFQISVNNKAGVPDSQLAALEEQLNAVLGAVEGTNGETVGAQFDPSGRSDYTLDVVNGNPGGNLGWQNSFLFIQFNATVNAAAVGAVFSMQPGVVGQVMGTVGAHELTHRIIKGVGDLPPGHGLMSLDALIARDKLLGTNLASTLLALPGVPRILQLTPDQVSALYNDCSHKHTPTQTPTSGPGGAGSGIASYGWDPFGVPGEVENCPPGYVVVNDNCVPRGSAE